MGFWWGRVGGVEGNMGIGLRMFHVFLVGFQVFLAFLVFGGVGSWAKPITTTSPKAIASDVMERQRDLNLH